MGLYGSPEDFGLKILGELDFSSGNYEFDLTIVFQDVKTGRIYYADDSGCSCPSHLEMTGPFEDMGRNDLVPVESAASLSRHLRNRNSGWNSSDVTPADIQRLVSKVRTRLGK
jgi:hypothetical protein